MIRPFLGFVFVLTGMVLWPAVSLAEPVSFDALSQQFVAHVRPKLSAYCLNCHSTEKKEGDLNLEQFAELGHVRKSPRIWQKVVEMLDNGEMPPEDAKQPTAEERKALRDWASRYLEAEGRAQAGDPGRVVLRRLSNVEYDLTIRDLTGFDLHPARQFPGDGAAGEGFTNVGEALVISPVSLQKYWDAAKSIADHAVLLPDGVRFSRSTTRRDWTNEIVADIRDIYRRYTDQSGERRVNLQGLNFEAESGGRIPLESYLNVLTSHRDQLTNGAISIHEVAAKGRLSEKYLHRLWMILNQSDSNPLLESLRTRWRSATPEKTPELADYIRSWQNSLTKFNSVAHFKTWQEPANPIVDAVGFRVKVPATEPGKDVVLRLIARDGGDGAEGDEVDWLNARIEKSGHPPIYLRDLRTGLAAIVQKRETLKAAKKYLDAVDSVRQLSSQLPVADLAREHQLDPQILAAWFQYLGIGSPGVKIETMFTERIDGSGGYDFVKGWGVPGTPNIVGNASNEQVRIPGIMKPRGIAVHPAPERNVAVGWLSPVAGRVNIEARVQHAHPECGNGLAWFIQLRRSGERRQLAHGELDRSQSAKIDPIADIDVRAGDLISLLIGPRASDHTCDLTEIELTITSRDAAAKTWTLSKDVASTIAASNPHDDSHGNKGVWHFYHEPVEIGNSLAGIPRGSLLDRWRDEPQADRRAAIAEQLQSLLATEQTADDKSSDAELRRQLWALDGPLFGRLDFSELAASSNQGAAEKPNSKAYGLAEDKFGSSSPGGENRNHLTVQAPSILEVPLPRELVAGREFVVDARFNPKGSTGGSVQLQATFDQPGPLNELVAGIPVMVRPGTAVRARLEKSFDDFRNVFPAAVCYPKIIPVDEVVTLVQFHRDDDRLSRLMLDDSEHQRLDRLWAELRYVSQDAFKVQEAYGQFMEYVTQDGDVRLFEPLRKPIADRAAALRQQLIDSESSHVTSVIEFAALAYRRPLTGEEQNGLRELYGRLRESKIEHEEAIRLTLARILVSPSFLYRVEQPTQDDKSQPVSNWELASRLSYFLWSSMPDPELRQAAASERLHDPKTLMAQVKRMLADEKVRPLATEFACQWLDVRGFDTFDEKNEKLFPEFGELRGDMYEESVRFFIDLFQRDGSILDILDADYSILNAKLAKHYGVEFPNGAAPGEWRRIEGMKKQGRGGILGMATTLAKHSGASRTSPILRGNWVSEFLLGEKLPNPPKNVPQLPEAENDSELTVRQLVEKHRSIAACAKCHDRIDPFGFALEAFDTIGRSRSADVAGRAIDTKVSLGNGATFDGLNGLRVYLLENRREQFVRQFCRKLLGYALGRGLQISDEPLLEEMNQRLKDNGYRFSSALEVVVQSQQFRFQRGRTIDEFGNLEH